MASMGVCRWDMDSMDDEPVVLGYCIDRGRIVAFVVSVLCGLLWIFWLEIGSR